MPGRRGHGTVRRHGGDRMGLPRRRPAAYRPAGRTLPRRTVRTDSNSGARIAICAAASGHERTSFYIENRDSRRVSHGPADRLTRASLSAVINGRADAYETQAEPQVRALARARAPLGRG